MLVLLLLLLVVVVVVVVAVAVAVIAHLQSLLRLKRESNCSLDQRLANRGQYKIIMQVYVVPNA